MSRNSGFNIGGKRKPSAQRFTPTIRGASGGTAAVAGGSRSPLPGVRNSSRSGKRGDRHTPGLRGAAAKKNDRLGPARGQVLSDGRVNGIHVRVSAPLAPNPDRGATALIDTKARERDVSMPMDPDMMASRSTQMIAGSEQPGRRRGAGRRPRVQQLPPDPNVLEVEAVETTPVVEVEPKPELPPGAYWSDKYDRYVEPGQPEYSEETAQRMGAA